MEHEFVEFIPDKLAERTLYVSIPFASTAHLCVCGCGTKVVTPISPTGWELLFDGDTISLRPSIGNWGLRCRSHYWIAHNQAVWAGSMTQEEIERGRQRDRKLTEAYFGEMVGETSKPAPTAVRKKNRRLRDWFRFI
jgi:Family of unknown function (DUF6527)